MKLSLFFIFSTVIFAKLAFADAHIDEMCKPLSKAKKWHRSSTIYWTQKVAPAYAQIVNDSKTHAIKNSTFKQALSSYNYTEDKINEHNRLRLQGECDLADLSSSNACHHFQAYCLNSISTKTLNKTFDSFNRCAVSRMDYCGESFQTPEGILANLRELEKAANEIFKTQDSIRQDSNLLEYFGDVEDSFDQLKRKLEEARQAAKKSAEQLDQEIKAHYTRLKSEDENFNNSCSILDQCDDYLKKEGYEDKYSLMNQTVFCSFNDSYSNEDLKPLENLLLGLNQQNEKESLKTLAIESLENAIDQTVKEYASTYKALYSNKPSVEQMCKDLPDFCDNKSAKESLRGFDLSNSPPFDTLSEIKQYNLYAKQMNSFCQKAKGGFVDQQVEGQISSQLNKVMYNTKIGQLMGVKNFRDKVPPFNQQKCFEDGIGFTLIDENDAGESFVKSGIMNILSLQKDKAEKLSSQKNQITYAGSFTNASDRDYYKILKDIVRNDPYMVRKVIKNSGSPDHALWICKATKDIYKTEYLENVGTWVGTGLAIAGSLVATIFTFGAATPMLIGSMALATSVGVYNLNKAYTAKHNTEQAVSIQSAEQVLASMNLVNIDGQVKAAYFEIGMSVLPIAFKGAQLTGKAVGPMLKSSELLKMIPSGTKLTGASKALVDAISKGQKVSKEMIQKALASRLPNASPDKIKHFAAILEGTSADMSLEMVVFASTFPDPPGPFSEQGMQSMALALGSSTAFNALGPTARTWVLKRKQANLTSSISHTAARNNASVIIDANTPRKQEVLTQFESQVDMNTRVIKLMDDAHNAPDGFAKNRQIKLLIDEISIQPGMNKTKAENLVLGVDDGSGIRKGGLASEDVMILGASFYPVKIKGLNNIDCAQVDCNSLIKYVKHADPNLKLDTFEPMRDVKKKIHSQIQNATTSTHSDKHLKSSINSEKDFKQMKAADKDQGQYFEMFKNKIKGKSQFEKELLRNENIGTYEFSKKGVMYKYIDFDEFKKAYPDFAKDHNGFGWGADCKGLAKFIRIEITNSESPVIHSHPRCRP